MSAVVVPVRDAVVKAFNDAGLQPALTAVGIYDLAYDLKALSGGRVAVAPQTKIPALLTRGGPQRNDTKIDLAVQYKYATPVAAEIDPYMKLTEAAGDAFLGKTLACDGLGQTGQGIAFTATCNEVTFPHGLYLHEHIKEFRVFTSVVTLHFLINA